MWEGVGDWTELQHIDPHSIGHNRVSFLFSWAAQQGAWGPTLLGAGFLYCILSITGLVSKLTDFLSSPSYIIVPSPTQSLEWHVWSSSSGNNCHAVHRSLSSSASVYDCTAGFYLVPFCQSSLPTPMEYALPPSLEWHVWPGRRSIYNIQFKTLNLKYPICFSFTGHEGATVKTHTFPGLQRVWIQSFSFPRSVVIPRLKSLVYPTIYL